MSVLAAAALGLAVTLAPPRSGPNCLTDECVEYPFTDVAAYVPTEYWWMYPAALLPLAYLILLVVLREALPDGRRMVADVAVLSTVVAVTALVMAYAVQLTVVQPSLVRGEGAPLILWSQYNPHGLFIALENVGYFFLSLALLATAGIFSGQGALRRITRGVAAVFGAIGVLGLPVLAVALRYDLEYQYEVLAIVATWCGLFLQGLLVAAMVSQSPHHRRESP